MSQQHQQQEQQLAEQPPPETHAAAAEAATTSVCRIVFQFQLICCKKETTLRGRVAAGGSWKKLICITNQQTLMHHALMRRILHSVCSIECRLSAKSGSWPSLAAFRDIASLQEHVQERFMAWMDVIRDAESMAEQLQLWPPPSETDAVSTQEA